MFFRIASDRYKSCIKFDKGNALLRFLEAAEAWVVLNSR